MSDQGELPPGADDSDEDLGEPIAELAGYEEAPSAGFFARVVGSLRRRTLGSQILTLAWSAMGEVVLEILKLIHSLFESDRSDRGE